MITRGAHHVSLDTVDLAASKRFYGDLLGLAEIERPDFGFPGVWYQAGPVQLHIIRVPEGVDVGSPPPGLTPLARHVAFEIEDYEATRVSLEAAGCELIATGEDVGQIFTRDPDGNVIEFIRPGGRLGRR